MEELNMTCRVCGEKYYICLTCKNTTSFESWRKFAHNINCYKIFMILRDNASLHFNPSSQDMVSIDNGVKKLLSQCDLSNVDSFLPIIKLDIEEIMQSE